MYDSLVSARLSAVVVNSLASLRRRRTISGRRRRAIFPREKDDAVAHDGVESPVQLARPQQTRRRLDGRDAISAAAPDAVRLRSLHLHAAALVDGPYHRQPTAAAAARRSVDFRSCVVGGHVGHVIVLGDDVVVAAASRYGDDDGRQREIVGVRHETRCTGVGRRRRRVGAARHTRQWTAQISRPIATCRHKCIRSEIIYHNYNKMRSSTFFCLPVTVKYVSMTLFFEFDI